MATADVREGRAADTLAWAAVVAMAPFVVIEASRVSSGFDSWPAVALARGVPYGANFMFAYPLPIYLPFTALGVLPDPWPQLVAPVVCLAFLTLGLWLWGGRRIAALAAVVLSPVGLGVVFNSNFNCAVAIFGLGLAVWARSKDRYALVGAGVALSLWRPANCLPALLVLALAGWRWRAVAEAAVGAAVVLVPLVALAFAADPGWVGVYMQLLPVYEGWSGLGPHLLATAGPVAYAAAQLAVGVAGVLLLRRRTVAEAMAFAFALSVFLATAAGSYSGSPALPALVLIANDARYVALPGIASVIGWIITTILLSINFAEAPVSYWFAVQAYPLLRGRRTDTTPSPSAGSRWSRTKRSAVPRDDELEVHLQ